VAHPLLLLFGERKLTYLVRIFEKVYLVNKKLLNFSWDALPAWDISDVEKERKKNSDEVGGWAQGTRWT